ncbi:dTMP kinase [Thermodesulfovibrio hydrogeniphilus]
MKKGIFITFEGIEGSGKTTQVKLLAERLKEQGFKVIKTFEPGDTQAGEKIREILLSPSININPLTELMLYFSDRVQHVEEKIRPAINQGIIVICDRFTDSTVAYQGYGRGLSIELIEELNYILLNNFKPDLTILLDLPAEIGLSRNQKINKRDRFEMEDIAFHNKVRKGYLQIASSEPERIFIVDATEDVSEISQKIYEIVRTKVNIG